MNLITSAGGDVVEVCGGGFPNFWSLPRQATWSIRLCGSVMYTAHRQIVPPQSMCGKLVGLWHSGTISESCGDLLHVSVGAISESCGLSGDLLH